MESHILNSYHQARYRSIGHKVLRAKSDSLSSESSAQNSPEYAQVTVQRPSYAARMQSEDSAGEEWPHNQTMNTTQSSQDSSSDEETEANDDVEQNIVVQENRIESDDELDDNIVVQEINVDDEDEEIDVDDDSSSQERIAPAQTANGFKNYIFAESNIEDNTLVEGHDYDVITVYTVNPDLDLIEASSDDEGPDFAVPEKEQVDDEFFNPNKVKDAPEPPPLSSSGIDLNLDTPVVSNVDEYFIKEKDILEADGPVVSDVDEYFIKDGKKERKESLTVHNVDDFFIKHETPENNTHFPVDAEHNKSVEELLVDNKNFEKIQPKMEVHVKVETVDEVLEDENNAEVSINESDLEVLPNIEDLKRYFLEEMSYTKFKSIERSCSLPQSPIQNICMDVDDAKTCLSFEDLNLDLSDLAFDSHDKDKSDANKSDDVPRTLTEEDVNSFLITDSISKPSQNEPKSDNFDTEDMEIEGTIDSPKIEVIVSPHIDPVRKLTSTPVPDSSLGNILDFCIEKSPVKKEKLPSRTEITPIKKEVIPIQKEHPIKNEPPIKKEPPPKSKMIAINPKLLIEPKPVDVKSADDDFVDVESCNDSVIPVLAANNLNSLLEQFEATEKLNKSKKPPRVVPIVPEEQKKPVNRNSLTNGMRLQDAGVQLNKNKMRQILMPSTINTAIRRSPSPVHSDHDYCSSKKRHSLPNLKGGQSLLKPEVLSSNSRILSSRHRSCKNKKIVYNLSSDDETESSAKNKKVPSDSELKKKTSIKPAVKPPAQSNCRKKLSPTHSVSNDVVIIKEKINNSVINKCASKASDTPCSQNSNGSIKLTIKNKSEVILNCDPKDSQKDKHNNNVEKFKSSSSVSDVPNVVTNIKQEKNVEKSIEKNIKEVDRNKNKCVNSSVEAVSNIVNVKEEPRPKDENFYNTLFSNKQDVKMPQVHVKIETTAFEEELNRAMEVKKDEPKKKKLNLQEYKLRRNNSSNNSSATVSPEAIFPDMPHPLLLTDKTAKKISHTPVNGLVNIVENGTNVSPKKIFDPIREASRKILMNSKKQKAEALRKRDEDIVMSKIPKVENLQLQPLISEAEMMKIVGMSQPEPVPVVNEKPQLPADYVEIILVSVGTNTDDSIIKKLEADMRHIEIASRKSTSPPVDPKSHINFKIKKSDHVLKQNVFDTKDKKDKRSSVDDNKHSETKIDKERFKDITATLKSVGKQVDNKMSSNSLFASIQDVVMKKAPEKDQESRKLRSPVEKREVFTFGRPTIVREYDDKAEHGEDKIILHLGKHRTKPDTTTIIVQTDPIPECPELSKAKTIAKEKSSVNRRRNDSDMSMSSSSDSPVRNKTTLKSEDKVVLKDIQPEKRALSKKRSRSKERYDKFRRRSRSVSRGRRRRRSPSRGRSRSKSRGRYHRRSYRRSDRSVSPYKRKRRSRSRSRSYNKRRSPTPRRDRDHRVNRSRSRSRQMSRSKSPVAKKSKPSPQKVVEKVIEKSMTPPLRKPTVSESSDSSTSSSSSSSTSSSSSSSSSSSGRSRVSRRSSSPYQRDEYRKKYRSFSSEDRDNNTPVEERRIVFVGKLERDITKSALRNQFNKFGPVIEVRLHTKDDGSRYGFVTYKHARDAWTAVDQAATFPQYDVGFGGRRAFCRQSYADLDGLEAKYTESAFHGAGALPPRRNNDISFEQMLLDMKKKLSQRKTDKKHDNP